MSPSDLYFLDYVLTIGGVMLFGYVALKYYERPGK